MTTLTRQAHAQPMQALVFDGAIRLGQLPRPEPTSGEALIRVRACAISRADLEMIQGRRPVHVRPVILGHQFVGDVVEGHGSAAEAWRGKRVVALPYAGCGGCSSCRRGERWLCINDKARALGMGLIDGAFAEYVTVPVGSLVEVPAAVDDDDAVFTHPVSSALVALRHVQGAPPQRVLVVGDGNMGLLITMLLHANGHTVSVFGRHPSRRDLLWRSGISFTGVHDSPHGEGVRPDEFARESFGTVIECSGRPSGFDLAMRAVRPRGRLVLVSYHAGEPGFDLGPLIDREIEIMGVSGGPLHDALDYLATSKLDTLPLVSGRFPLADGVRAIQQATRRGTLKVILRGAGAERRGEEA